MLPQNNPRICKFYNNVATFSTYTYTALTLQYKTELIINGSER